MAEPRLLSAGIVDAHFGQNVRVVQPVNLYGCTIGDDSFIGPFVEIQRGVVIGKRCKIQSHAFDIGKGEPLKLTVSIGVADFPEAKVETAEDLLDCADQALYRAKAGGRNLVCV